MKIYKYQVDQGRYFLHEHPAAARSWKEPYVKKIAEMQDVLISQLDQCQYGLWVEDRCGSALAKEPTKFMTAQLASFVFRPSSSYHAPI